ncbi:MAG: rhodanese-like domain-containing protein [Flavobacteriales bacterium]
MKEMSVHELKEKLDNGEAIKVIDVREPDEAEICTIGAELIPMGSIMDRVEELPRDRPLVIHCRSGKRSGKVVEKLEELGFDNTYNLEGGILAWSDEIDPSLPKY